MGLFSYLFGKEPPIQPPVLVSILPPQAAQRIYAGMLPNLQADKLILNSGEICHFVDVAAIITEKKHYESRHDGASFRVFKGFTYITDIAKWCDVSFYRIFNITIPDEKLHLDNFRAVDRICETIRGEMEQSL